MRIAAALALCATMFVTGCHRTHYVNFEPPTDASEARERPNVEGYTKNNGWQHFFVYGWVPSQRKYRVDAICGGSERVQAIRTRETFVQALIAAFAGFYINIYSPYTAEFECRPG